MQQTDIENPYMINNVAGAEPDVRAEFIRKTYTHLAGAILAFIGIEYLLLQLPIGQAVASWAMSGSFNMLILFGAFIGVSWLANFWAHSNTSPGLQYFGLGVYVVAEAFFFLPILYIVTEFASPDVIPTAGLITGTLFAGLTFIVFTTRKDFSWMRSILMIAGMVAFGIIAASWIFSFSLGLLFSGAMVLFASGMILYTTSNVLHHYHPTQHVAASLALFASVALLFWYILRIVLAFSRN